MSSVVGAAQHSGSRKVTYFGSAHPLADAASHTCETARHATHRALIGEIACGRCWETAIRTDERVIIECGLPRDIAAEKSFVDEVAVARALHGESVALTPAERHEAIRRLSRQGLSKGQVSRRLRAARAVENSRIEQGTPVAVSRETVVAA